MRVRKIDLENFRGIRSASVLLEQHTLLVGGNGVGKSTLCESLDLVLGPERQFRRPLLDEYDFFESRYLPSLVTASDTSEVDEGSASSEAVETTDSPETAAGPEISVRVVLVDLSEHALRRFAPHLRKWDEAATEFGDQDPARADVDDLPWCLPVEFRGRYSATEDDFEGGTYFSHPIQEDPLRSPEDLARGQRVFTREDKRLCGYVYLRANRTGSRALGMQRGSLLDTVIRLGADGEASIWEHIRTSLETSGVDQDDSTLDLVLRQVEKRVGQFLGLGPSTRNVHINPSELTRQSMRDSLRLFVSPSPNAHPIPVNRLSTGAINLLVFALLTYIAELKVESNVIFAIEEPEIAVPPHAQRRLMEFALARMGQTITTSHSPYVIELYDPEKILVLQHEDDGSVTGSPLTLPAGFKAKRYRENRRQFAEAVLARGVLVVEGGTEASVVPAVAEVMDSDADFDYVHPDLAGLTIVDAGNDVSVPIYAPVFARLGKRVYGLHDTPNAPFDAGLTKKTYFFDVYKEIPYSGIEDLLVSEMPAAPKRRFMTSAMTRDDYPTDAPKWSELSSDEETDKAVRWVLRARKGAYSGYAALLASQATSASELPQTLVQFLVDVDRDLNGQSAGSPSADDADASDLIE